MKKRLISILFVLIVALAMATVSWAASSVSTSPPQGKGLKVMTMKVTTHTTGAVTQYAIPYSFKGAVLWYIQTIPGATQPTAATTIVLTNNGQTYTHLRTAADETKTLLPTFNGIAKPAPINGQCLLDVSGNVVNSAIITVNLFYFED